jgi:LPXTG-site transpeptidase (sortase) family protein
VKRRHAEFLLALGGACLIIKGGWALANYAAFQSHPEWYSRAPKQALLNSADTGALLPLLFHAPNDLSGVASLHVLGKLEIPRLAMYVLVVEGDDEQKLGLAAGHLSGTPGFGQMGNTVVAGHRDTSFWPLRKIRIGDRVRVRAGRTDEYVVSSVRIVNPDDLSVLGNTDKRTLTMVTCYPFRYFGSAPKRFIVQAILAGS